VPFDPPQVMVAPPSRRARRHNAQPQPQPQPLLDP